MAPHRAILRRYHRLPGTEGVQDCIYCGEPAEHIDHVLPIRYSNWRDDLTQAERDQLVTVPSCSECNGIAGARVFHSLLEKRDYIRARLARRYERALGLPHWTDAEIRSLGDGIRDYVDAGQARKRLVTWRLAYEGIPTEHMTCVPVNHQRVDCAMCGETDWCNTTDIDGERMPICSDCWGAM